MSYILEALRKSQQDREIGQVPTLATQPLFMSQESGGNFRGLAAVALAGLAVAIALYAALRAGPEVAPGEHPGSAHDPDSGTRPGRRPSCRARAWHQPRAPGDPGSDPSPPCRGARGGLTRRITRAPAAGGSGPAAPPAPAAWPHPPRPRFGYRRERMKCWLKLGSTSPATQPRGNEGSVVAPSPPDGIPDDLRQDIQSFKEQLKEGQGGKAAKKASTQKQLPPQERRLPREVEQRLPSFLLTVHIYDAEPAKRFVVIDGRKLRQGDSSRGGILVKEILPTASPCPLKDIDSFGHARQPT